MTTPNHTSIVMITRNRLTNVLSTLSQLTSLQESSPLILVDNGSTDGTAEAVAQAYPGVELIRLEENLGAAARNIGVSRARTPYIAFSDDDSWWASGSFARAESLFEEFPRLGLIAARVLVGPQNRVDPTCLEMRESPLSASMALPGPCVLGFIACGSIVRKSAFLQAGGFDAHFGVGGEEELLAIDLATHQWGLAYVDDIIAHHHPSPSRDPARRLRIATRNRLWVSWLRRSPQDAMKKTLHYIFSDSPRSQTFYLAISDALKGLPWVLRSRKRMPRELEAQLRKLG